MNNGYSLNMTYKINKPKPVKTPPTTISIEMTEREARLLSAFLGKFTSHDFMDTVNEVIKMDNLKITQITESLDEDIGFKVYDVLQDAFKNI